ncbi:MAG: M16 family metallopeptidase, partial [Campylobacter hyointestinalis]
IMENLALKDDEFQTERDVVLEERRWRTDNDPIGLMYFRLFNNAFIYHPYHWTPIGFFRDIENWNIEDIKAFWQTYYQPKNAFLMITGDCDEKTAFEYGIKHFSKIKNRKDIPNFYFKEPDQNGEKKVILHKDSDVEMLSLAYKIPPFNHKDQIALDALSNYLSSGKSSILQKKLMDELNLINQIYAYRIDCKDEGLFVFLAVCNPEIDASKVEIELLNLIEQTKQELIGDDELFKIKNSLRSELVYSLTSASKLANLYGSYIARGDIEPLYELENASESLNSQSIKDIANRYFISKNLTTIILKKGLK